MRSHPAPKPREQRKRDALARLRDHLPLSCQWGGETITVATPEPEGGGEANAIPGRDVTRDGEWLV